MIDGRTRVRAVMLAGAAVCAAIMPVDARAQSAPAISYHIAAGQPLASALNAYAAQSGINILFSPTLVRDKRSRGLEGTHDARAALTALLEGTGLRARPGRRGTVLIEAVAAGADASPALLTPGDRQAETGAGPDTSRLADTGDQDEIVVTGSRIPTNGNRQPTPVTVVSSERLAAASPKGVAEALVQLPSFVGSNSRTAGGAAANAGHTYLNLRGLGVARNLVLLDGRRFVATSDGGAADINLFPQLLLQRVEVVTGGASAAYGSDAVAGVTNFILDKDFRGLKGMVSGGTTEYGDGQTFRASIAGGHAFLDNRLRVIASFDYTHSEGVVGYAIGGPTRDWQKAGRFLINNPRVTPANPASPTNPGLIVGSDVRFPYASLGGVISGGPLRGIQFLPGGGTAPFDYGRNTTAGFTEGGDGATSAGGANIETPIESRVAFAHAEFDVADTVTLYAEGHYAYTKVYQKAGPSYGFNPTAYTIFADNAFLPADLRQRMADEKIASFPLGRWNLDFGVYRKEVVTETLRGVFGARGKFGDGWTWDAYFEHGENRGDFFGRNGLVTENLYRAVDAVQHNGRTVCRSTIANPNDGCVPINLFGAGSPSSEALAYVGGVPEAHQKVTQDVFDLTVQGQPFSTWAGPVKVAVGYTHRREGLKQRVDPLSTIIKTGTGIRGFPASLRGTQGGYFLGNSNPVDGSYKVDEGFIEAGIPLLADSALGKSLELNAAGRFTKYSSVGSVTTWKFGLTYAPVEDLRFRGTISRDLRAPNVGELYLSQAQTISAVLDTANGNVPATATILLPGNPDLVAETAKTYTVGAVFTPRFLPGFSASVDYYDISIKAAIGRLSNQTTVDQCAQGNSALCQLITRTPDGTISIIQTPNLNLADLKTRGLDIEVNYATDLSRFGDSLPGRLALRVLATKVFKFTNTTKGSPTIDSTDTIPFQLTMTANYDVGAFGLFVQERLIGAREIDATYTPSRIAVNRIGPAWYTDLTLNWRPVRDRPELSFFATINNLFDRDPPTGILVGSTQGTPTISAYDQLGRYYTAGMRFRF